MCYSYYMLLLYMLIYSCTDIKGHFLPSRETLIIYLDSCHSLHLTRQEVGQASWEECLRNHCVAGKMYYVKACGCWQQNDSLVCYLTHAEGKATCLPWLSCLLVHTHKCTEKHSHTHTQYGNCTWALRISEIQPLAYRLHSKHGI